MAQPNPAATVRAWMRHVLAERDWSAERWAREAGVSPTTITRFLNSDASHVPTYRTLRKLADAAHTAVPDVGTDNLTITRGIKSVAVVYPDDLGSAPIRAERSYFNALTGRRVMVTGVDTEEVICAAVVTRDTYDARGVLPGDIVHLVAYDGQQDRPVLVREQGRQFAVYRIEGDWLMPFSTQGHPPRPVAPDDILGYVVKLERPVD